MMDLTVGDPTYRWILSKLEGLKRLARLSGVTPEQLDLMLAFEKRKAEYERKYNLGVAAPPAGPRT